MHVSGSFSGSLRSRCATVLKNNRSPGTFMEHTDERFDDLLVPVRAFAAAVFGAVGRWGGGGGGGVDVDAGRVRRGADLDAGADGGAVLSRSSATGYRQ